jgi:hypothetical protein
MTNKQAIIPEDWKPRIDEVVEEQLVGANRYFAEANPQLAQLIEREKKRSPQDFNRALRDRWKWHNVLYETLLEPALPDLFWRTGQDAYPRLIELWSRVYQAGSLVDQATLILSAAIKKHVDYWLTMPQYASLSKEEHYLLLTPPVEFFWIRYELEHLRYLLLQKQEGDSEDSRQQLIQRYHAGDLKIFEGRMRRFAHEAKLSIEEFRDVIRQLEDRPDYATRHFYFTLEHSGRKALRDTIAFDNVEEKEMVTTLIGISGFVFRWRILGMLQKENVLGKAHGIYEFSDQQVLGGLDKLRQGQTKSMLCDVSVYRQVWDSCAACTLMMAFDYFGLMKNSSQEETKLHRATGSKLIAGNHFAALAHQAGVRDVEACLQHSDPNMFHNDSNVLSNSLFNQLMSEYRDHLVKAQRFGATVNNGVEISPAVVRKWLAEGYLVSIAGRIGSIWHAVLAVGYDPDYLIINDPLSGKQERWTDQQLDRFMQTEIGRWLLALKPRHLAVEGLQKRLADFSEQARAYLAIVPSAKKLTH